MRNQIGRHWLLIVLIAIAIFVGSTSCQRDSDVPKETNVENPKPQPVKVVLAQNPVPHSALPIIAKKKGFFEQEGLDVDVAEFTTGKLCFDAMLGGGADFSTVAETPLMYAGFSDQPVRIVATIVTSSETLKIVARKDAGVAKPSDLRGKPVGTFKGGNAEFFLAKFLKKHGLDLTDVKAIYMQPPELITAISRGDLAAISMWEPHAYNAAKALGDNAIVFSDNDLYVETFNIAVKSEFAETRGPVIEKFLRALLKAEKLLKNDPEAAKEILVSTTSIQRDVLDHVWPYFQFGLSSGEQLINMMTQEAQFAIESGARPAGTPIPDYSKMVDGRFLDKVK